MDNLKDWLGARKTDDKSIVVLLIKGYIFLTVLCFIFLVLPVSQSAQNSIVDHLFFAVSIVSTTGLAPADFSTSYNLFGQVISLIFIQLGGIGYMALSSFIILKQFDKLPSLSARLLRLEYNLPQKYPLVSFIYSVFIFTVLIETVGAIVLYFGFKELGIENPLWQAIFHSISAFCTAGFSLFGDSMTSFSDSSLITTTILILSLLGSIGFIVLLDFWLRLIGKRKNITLTSKIILLSTFVFWITASIAIFLSDSELLGRGWEGMKLSIFQSISAHTTVGFNNYDIGAIDSGGIFILIVLMVIGASPAGTGGGIKTTSITALIAVLTSILKRRERVTFFKKEIPAPNIYLAVSSAIFYTFILLLGTWVVLIIDGENFAFEQILFEVTSALSTVGISTGITGDLSDLSKLIISTLMFIGRLGVLTFGFALISKTPLLRNKPEVEDIAI
ncbi:MAG: TrkH family potassium uptake protein [Saprospiraceae bacterium]